MTTKRTHGPCTCTRYHPEAGHEASCPALYPAPKRTYGQCTCGYWDDPGHMEGHQPDCPALYPAQTEPDALTRLVRLIREHCQQGFPQEGFPESEALSLISEAREEQRKAVADGLLKAAEWAGDYIRGADDRIPLNPLADHVEAGILALKDPEP